MTYEQLKAERFGLPKPMWAAYTHVDEMNPTPRHCVYLEALAPTLAELKTKLGTKIGGGFSIEVRKVHSEEEAKFYEIVPSPWYEVEYRDAEEAAMRREFERDTGGS